MFGRFKYVVVCGVVSLAFVGSAWAQVFDDSGTSETSPAWQNVKKKQSTSKNSAKYWGMTEHNISSSDTSNAGVMIPPAKQEVINPEDYQYKKVPQTAKPTLDGVKRGRVTVTPVIVDTKVATEGFIYVYYSDFSLGQMAGGSVTCNVRFQILTTLDRKLNSIAFRLKWPSMETPLTFLDVNPNQPYHLDYTLLGDGCYSMDKLPNIIINRCRVKGMTQEECAKKVRWLRKL